LQKTTARRVLEELRRTSTTRRTEMYHYAKRDGTSLTEK
jgi:hypothetical protein